MTAPLDVPGLRLIPDWMGLEAATGLLTWIDAQPWESPLQRRVQQYGAPYLYRARVVADRTSTVPLPAPLAALAQRLHQEGAYAEPPQQVIINEYTPGQGISAHRDHPGFGPVVASLSLGGAVSMVFAQGDTRAELRLPTRGLLLLTGPARTTWTHQIPARRSDPVDGVRVPRTRRISLTFRTVP